MEKTYYILRLDSYTGSGSSMICSAANNAYMFAVLLVAGHHAEIIDYGYSSIAELSEAWGDVPFENMENYR
jgi:hypothetical protein